MGERSQRGRCGHFFVWGDGFDPSYACMRNSHKKVEAPVPSLVDSFPIDESVYGVRGMAGNIMEWTGFTWSGKMV